MKDIDILGVTESGKIISAQVTYKRRNDGDGKLERLKPYLENGNETIYFCRCEQAHQRDGHLVFPLELVFKDFCVNDKDGQEWFRRATGV